MQLNGDSRSLAFCPQTAWLTGGASLPPPDFIQFTAPFRERPPFLANQFSFRATTDRTIFILWCRRLWSFCPVDLRRLPRGHAHHHHLEPQGPRPELWTEYHNHHGGHEDQHVDHLQCGLHPHRGVHLQSLKPSRVSHSCCKVECQW